MSPLFNGLEYFTRLTVLKLALRLDNHSFPDPTGLNRLLAQHQNLQKLVIMQQARFLMPENPSANYTLSDWYKRTFQGISFKGLKDLDLGLDARDVPRSIFQPVFVLCQTVTSLIIRQRRLTFGELSFVLASFPSHQLKHLSLFVTKLSPQLLDLLAENCTGLERLVLDIEHICAYEHSGNLDDKVGV